jgi:FtsP/CotA-like multicopper oxidase with cupredoxin domain
MRRSTLSSKIVRVHSQPAIPSYEETFPRIAATRPGYPPAYFSENATQTQFFITLDGQRPVVFSADNPPAVVTTQGSVEDWTIENRAQENHEFHFHQIHFLVLSQDNFQINGSQPAQAI